MQSIRDLIDASPAALIALAIVWGLLPSLDAQANGHRRIVIALFAFVTLRYYMWRVPGIIGYSDFDGTGGIFSWTVLAFELLGLMEAIVAITMLARVVDRKPETESHAAALATRNSTSYPMVDVFIPTYNEDIDVLEKTILGAANLDWPVSRFKVWVLDDGRRDWLRDYCAGHEVGYLRRSDNSHAKAGNINAALKTTSGEFIAVFDADFVPRHNFLKRLIGWFDDPHIGIVQAPHHFYNSDPIQANLLLDGVMPDDQRMFFDVIQPSRDAWDASFCCGSCGVLRRKAVEAIGGGIPTASVTEDILTTLAMKRHGYITRFVNEQLAFGLAAESGEAFFVQRKRWLRGGIQLIFLRDGPLGPGHRPIDRILFFPISWIGQYTIRLFALAVPAICLWTDLNPLPGATTVDVLSYQAPFFIAFFAMMRWFAPGHHVPLLTAASQTFAAFRLVPTLLGSLIKPFGVAFKVTPKGSAAASGSIDRTTFTIALGVFIAVLAGIAVNAYPRGGPSSGFFPIVMGWSLWNLIVLGVVMMMCFETPRRRQEQRFDANEMVMIRTAGAEFTAIALDYSLSGARLRLLGDASILEAGMLTVQIPRIGKVPSKAVGKNGDVLRVAFEWGEPSQREAMIIKLFASGMHPAGMRKIPIYRILLATWHRIFGSTWLEGPLATKGAT